MSRMQQLPDKAYLALKAAFRQLRKDCGGCEAAALITRADHQRISKYGVPREVMHAPIDVIADLENDAGDPIVTRELAALSGYVLVKKPDVQAGGNWNVEIARLANEFGEAVAKVSEALADDGEISVDESKKLRLRAEVRDVMERAAVLDRMLACVEGEE